MVGITRTKSDDFRGGAEAFHQKRKAKFKGELRRLRTWTAF
jgi:hypothetical protein